MKRPAGDADLALLCLIGSKGDDGQAALPEMAAFVGLTARALVVTLRCVAPARLRCETLPVRVVHVSHWIPVASPPPSPKIFASVKNV